MNHNGRRPRVPTVEEELYGLHFCRLEELFEALCFVCEDYSWRPRHSKPKLIEQIGRMAERHDIASHADLCTFLQHQLYQKPSVSLWHWSLQSPPSQPLCPVWWIDQVWMIPLPSRCTWKGEVVMFKWHEAFCRTLVDQGGFSLQVPLSRADDAMFRVHWNKGRAYLHPEIRECLVEELCAPHPQAHLSVMPLSAIQEVLQLQKVRLLQELDPYLIPVLARLIVNFL